MVVELIRLFVCDNQPLDKLEPDRQLKSTSFIAASNGIAREQVF
jgi:hypothetical protein